MIEIKLQRKDYNHDKLRGELETSPVFDALSVRGGTYYALLSDDATQEQIDTIHTMASNHDDSMTTEQLAEQTRIAIADSSSFSKTYAPLLVASFNDPLQTLRANETLTLATWYSTWRTVYAGWVAQLGDELTGRVEDYIVGFVVPGTFSFTEPTPLTDLYKVQFNKHISDFLGYITDLAQM